MKHLTITASKLSNPTTWPASHGAAAGHSITRATQIIPPPDKPTFRKLQLHKNHAGARVRANKIYAQGGDRALGARAWDSTRPIKIMLPPE
eukprot:11327498-Alexandrium_andersonii.AAC.1